MIVLNYEIDGAEEVHRDQYLIVCAGEDKMRGEFYIVRNIEGNNIEKPEKIIGSISVDNKKLYGFSGDSYLIKMNILDFIISADGILFKGIEELQDGKRMVYNEIYFVPT